MPLDIVAAIVRPCAGADLAPAGSTHALSTRLMLRSEGAKPLLTTPSATNHLASGQSSQAPPSNEDGRQCLPGADAALSFRSRPWRWSGTFLMPVPLTPWHAISPTHLRTLKFAGCLLVEDREVLRCDHVWAFRSFSCVVDRSASGAPGLLGLMIVSWWVGNQESFRCQFMHRIEIEKAFGPRRRLVSVAGRRL